MGGECSGLKWWGILHQVCCTGHVDYVADQKLVSIKSGNGRNGHCGGDGVRAWVSVGESIGRSRYRRDRARLGDRAAISVREIDTWPQDSSSGAISVVHLCDCDGLVQGDSCVVRACGRVGQGG